MSSTAVTMYFNIKNFPDATDNVRPKSFYMDKGRATLALDVPMVVFCDDTCVDDIKELRGDRPTEYIVKPLVEYDFYKDHYQTIRHNREGNPMYVNSRNTTSYCLLTVFKFYAVHSTAMKNPFNTTHFAWVDFGCSHILRDLPTDGPKMLAQPNPKISFCYIHYRGAEDLTMTSHFGRGGLCGVAATCFTVEGTYSAQFYHGCMAIFHEMLVHKNCHHEEQIMAYFYHRYPELCTIYYGDYYSVASNYHGVREDFPGIWHHFIQEALRKNRHDLAKECARAVLDSVEKGRISLCYNDVALLQGI
jgi:hypothetical protein